MRERLNNPSFASPLPVPILIADKNCCVDSLAELLRSSIPGIALSLCYSHSYAMHGLTNGRYQVVVCGVQLSRRAELLAVKTPSSVSIMGPLHCYCRATR